MGILRIPDRADQREGRARAALCAKARASAIRPDKSALVAKLKAEAEARAVWPPAFLTKPLAIEIDL